MEIIINQIIKYIKDRYSTDPENKKIYEFGYNWNSTFPYKYDMPLEIRDSIYIGMCFLLKYQMKYVPEGKQYDTTISSLLEYFEKIKETGSIPSGMHYIGYIDLRNSVYLIKYQLELYQKYLKNKTS